MPNITSTANEHIKGLARLHEKKGRDEQGLFLVEGEHLIEEAWKAEVLEEVLIAEGYRLPFSFAPVIQVSAAVLKKLSTSVSAASCIGVCRMRETGIDRLARLVLLDDIQDPGNLGTLIRTAVSFCYDGVILSAGCCDIYNDKAVRSTQGALFHIPVVRMDLLQAAADLKARGVRVYATALEASIPLEQVAPQKKMAFIFGNEGQGVHTQLQMAADACLRIEMSGFESLNVAVAGGIVLYRFRQTPQ